LRPRWRIATGNIRPLRWGNQYNHFLKNLAIFGGALIIFAAGPGRFSIDRMLSKKG
jgi:uncharacterized membrane protein YphA (DoxX/SURF4 family)